MCGTAAEVTPIRAVDDHEIGVGPDHAARSRRRTSTPCTAAASAGRSGSSTRRPRRRAGVKQEVDARSRSRRPYLDEREEELVLEVLRSGRLSLGPTIDRFEELFAERGRRAVRGRRLVGHRRPAPARASRRRRARRRGDHVAVLVRRVARTASSTRAATPVFADIDPRTLQPRPGRGRGRDHAADEGDRRGRHLRLPVRARRAARDRATGTGSR